MATETICDVCGAKEVTKASIDRRCFFCSSGRMRVDFILTLDETGRVEKCKVLEYSPTLHEVTLRQCEMLSYPEPSSNPTPKTKKEVQEK